jgi:3-dehydroquinate synthase
MISWAVKANQNIEFNIDAVDNVFETLSTISHRLFIVIDKTVYDLYNEQLPEDVLYCVIECSEESKTLETCNIILEFLTHNQVLRRSEPIYAIGGGVLLDLVGYACSIYRRGIPYIRVPTTLLSIVDASVGAKVGINYMGRRNRLGGYYPPVQSLIDIRFIQTQDSRNISNGLAEILKLALVLDARLFYCIETHYEELLESKFIRGPSKEVIERSISGMITELQDNLWEKDLERSVDFGHSFSPIIEMKHSTELLHGEAVILDCILSCIISRNRKLLSDDDLTRIVKTIRNLNLPVSHPSFLNINMLKESLKEVIAHRDGNQNLPLVNGIGKHVFANDISNSELEKAIETWQQF